ncbi:hypothetical protein CTM_16462, partial [Clostridium tetanomorphum DSM 665]
INVNLTDKIVEKNRKKTCMTIKKRNLIINYIRIIMQLFVQKFKLNILKKLLTFDIYCDKIVNNKFRK